MRVALVNHCIENPPIFRIPKLSKIACFCPPDHCIRNLYFSNPSSLALNPLDAALLMRQVPVLHMSG